MNILQSLFILTFLNRKTSISLDLFFDSCKVKKRYDRFIANLIFFNGLGLGTSLWELYLTEEEITRANDGTGLAPIRRINVNNERTVEWWIKIFRNTNTLWIITYIQRQNRTLLNKWYYNL